MLKKIQTIFLLIEDYTSPILLAALITVLSIQMIGRWLGLAYYLMWTDEVARALFVCSIFMGLPLANKNKAMISINIFKNLNKQKKLISSIIWLLCCIFIIVLSVIHLKNAWVFPERTPVLNLNKIYFNAVVPLSFFMVAIRVTLEMIKELKR